MKKLVILLITLTSLNANAAGLATALQAKMDYLIARQNVVSANIANASTPNFIAKDIAYQPRSAKSNTLKMAGTSAKHLNANSTVGGFKVTEDRTFIRNDGNSVRTDQEMLKMARIQQEYTMATRLFTKHMAMQKLAVQSK